MDNRPIGFFDSGLGGLTVLKSAIKLLPSESFVYYGDHKNVPYGDKPLEQIKHLAFDCASFLMQKNVKSIVIACNTATSAAIEDIRQELKIPVISIEPAIKPALLQTDGKVLMMATGNTCKLDRYLLLKNRLDTQNRVIDVPCHNLAQAIEDDNIANYDSFFNDFLLPFRETNPTAIVLGCTHYPIILPQLASWCQINLGDIKIFHGAQGTANQLARVLKAQQIEASPSAKQTIDLYTSGDVVPIINKMRNILYL